MSVDETGEKKVEPLYTARVSSALGGKGVHVGSFEQVTESLRLWADAGLSVIVERFHGEE